MCSMIEFVLKKVGDLKVYFEFIDREKGCGRKEGRSNTFYSGDVIYMKTSQPEVKLYMASMR